MTHLTVPQKPYVAPSGDRPAAFLYADFIRAYATVCIIVVHCAVLYLGKFPQLNPQWWWLANGINALCRPGVPLFILLSGALLLSPDKSESIATFLRKRIRRILIPFWIWATIHLVWRIQVYSESLSFLDSIHAIIQGTVFGHLWFVYMIGGLYLITPILRVYVKAASLANLKYFLGLWFIVASVIPSIEKFTLVKSFLAAFVPLGGFTGLFIAGYVLNQISVPRRAKPWIVAGALGGAVISAIATYFVTAMGNHLDNFFYEGLSPSVVMMTMCVFLLLKDLPYDRWSMRFPWLMRFICAISSASFTIYLLQIIVLDIIQFGKLGFTFSPLSWHPFIGIPILASLTLVLCMAFTFIVRKVPFGSVIAP